MTTEYSNPGDIPLPPGVIQTHEWEPEGRWLVVSEFDITLFGHPSDLWGPSKINGFAMGCQRPNGRVVSPYLHLESNADDPLTIGDIDELISALTDARGKLRRLVGYCGDA